MLHWNITFPEDLARELDREARREDTKRSTLIQSAVRVYLKLKRRREIVELLREGYQEMAGEAQQMIKDFEKLDNDSLRYVD